MSKTTLATCFSDLFARAGSREKNQMFTTMHGRNFFDVLEEMGADGEFSYEENGTYHVCSAEEADGGRMRFVFPDGSAILEAGGVWQLEADAPWKPVKPLPF